MTTIFTVTSANTDRSLLTQAELAQAVPGWAGDQKRLATLGLRVSALITKACRVRSDGATPPTLRLESIKDTFRLRGCPLEKLNLSRRPVVSIESVVENDLTLIADDDYELASASALLFRRSRGCHSFWGRGNVIVSYSAGWATVPHDLRELAAKFATMLAAESGRDPSIGSESIPGVYDATYRYGRPDDPLVPAEILEGLSQGGFINYWAL
jgi:hypothetical protein